MENITKKDNECIENVRSCKISVRKVEFGSSGSIPDWVLGNFLFVSTCKITL
jgi:hypothetical protein